MQASARTANGVRDNLQCQVLSNNTFTQAILHLEQLLYLGLHQPGDGNMRPFRDNLGDILSVDLFFEHTRALQIDEF